MDYSRFIDYSNISWGFKVAVCVAAVSIRAQAGCAAQLKEKELEKVVSPFFGWLVMLYWV